MSDETDSRYGRTRTAATVSVTPTQVAAARVRVAGDRQLDRDTPPWIKRLAEAVRPTTTGGEACDCGHDWERHGSEAGGCIECRCPHPAPSVTPDSDQLRDEIAEKLAAVLGWRGFVLRGGDARAATDALLSGPVGQLLARAETAERALSIARRGWEHAQVERDQLLREHTERGEALERVRAQADAQCPVRMVRNGVPCTCATTHAAHRAMLAGPPPRDDGDAP